jgi:hypothetical protein
MLLGERRRVVEVNEIVGDAGMARLAQEDRLKDGGSLELKYGFDVGIPCRRADQVRRAASAHR